MAELSRRDFLKAGGGLAAGSVAAPLLGRTRSPGSRKHVHVPTSATQVTFWCTLTDIYYKSAQHIVNNFNSSNKHNIQVKIVQVPVEATNDTSKLLTAVRGGTGPDVYFLDRFVVTQEAATGVLENLSKYVSKEKSLPSQYLSYAWKEVEFKKTPFALPFDTDVRALYYNKTVLQQAGLDPAELDIKNGPITVDRMRQINQKVNQVASNGNYSRVGVVPWFDQGETYTWGFIYGGSFANAKKCQVTPTNSGAIDGLQYIYDWAKEFGPDKLASFISAYAPMHAPPATYPLFQNRTALSLTGDWQISAIQQYVPTLQYGITYLPIPKKGDKPSTWSGGFSLVIPHGAKNADGAWEFMRYACGTAGQRTYTKDTTHTPTWKSLLQEKNLFGPQHQIFTQKLLPITRSRPPLPVGSLYWDQLQNAESQVELNQKEPKAALEAVATAVNPRLQPYCPIT